VQVVPSHGLTAEEVERIEAESYAHAREDMLVHRVVDLAVNAALDAKWIEEALGRVRDELDPAIVAEVESGIAEVRGFVEASRQDPRTVDADAFHAAKDRLDRASVPVHETAITRSLREEAEAVKDR
jgi:molecular chaperone DnaK (HSP70)